MGKFLEKKILAVDDSPVNLEALLHLLGEQYDLRVAIDGTSALELIDSGFTPDLMLLDIVMSDMNGYELCQIMQQKEQLKDVPFIFLSALDNEEDESQGLLLGAADYISKPFQPAILLQRIKLQLELKRYRDNLQLLVTEKTRKLQQAEQKALQQEALYRELFNNMGNAVIVFDAMDNNRKFLLQNINQSGLNTFASRRQDCIGKKLVDLLPQAYQTGLLDAFVRVSRTGNPEQLAACRYRHLNFTLWLEVYIYKLPSGQVVGIFADVTEKKEFEEKIVRAKTEWEQTFDAMADCVTILNNDLQIIRANKATHALFNAPYNGLIGKTCHELFSDRTDICEECPAMLTFAGQQPQAKSLTHKHLGRTFDVSCSLLSSGKNETPYLIHVARDVTEHKQLQEEVNRSHRLASIGELAAGIAHEINNPNGLILHNSQLVNDVFNDLIPALEQCLHEDPDRTYGGLDADDIINMMPQMLEDIYGASRRIKHIVTELRDFSSYDTSDRQSSIDLNQVVRSSLHLVNNAMKKATANIRVELDAELPPVEGVTTRLEQVIINLLINASQALQSHDDSITVKTLCDADRQHLKVIVADTGCGIADELQEHICEPFFTTKREKGGTGLGLSVSTRIVKAHRGTLKFTPNTPKGTIVTLELPAGTLYHDSL